MSKIIRSNKRHKKLSAKSKNMGIYWYHQEVIEKQEKLNRLLTKLEKQKIYNDWK